MPAHLGKHSSPGCSIINYICLMQKGGCDLVVKLSDSACPMSVLSRSEITSMNEKAHQILAQQHSDWVNTKKLAGYFDEGHSEPVEFILESELTIGTFGAGDTKHLTQFGAEAIALQLAEDRKLYYAFDRTAIGTGVDYSLRRIGHNPPAGINFLALDPDKDARLEVSGTTIAGLFEDRIKEKKRQTYKSDHVGTVAFICVVDFSTPKIHFSERHP